MSEENRLQLFDQEEEKTPVLTAEEQKQVDEFATTIDLTDSAFVLQYGAACQKKISTFSDSALEGVRTKDLGQTGEMITALVAELKGFSDTEEEKGFLGFFKKAGNQVTRLKARYDKAEVSVERITEELEKHQNQLLTDIVMLDQMYKTNLEYYKELTFYVAAGQKKLTETRQEILPAKKLLAEQSGDPQAAQEVNDLASQCERFEKKLADLTLTRTISMQMAPQIRLIQNNDALMSEKIQSVIHNTIPLWKNQMVLALGMAHSTSAMEAQRRVTDLTNQLLRQNADALESGTIAVAKESERGILDLETLQHTNERLIATLDEVLNIQEEGRKKRQEAEQELGRMETELKGKLLEIRK